MSGGSGTVSEKKKELLYLISVFVPIMAPALITASPVF